MPNPSPLESPAIDPIAYRQGLAASIQSDLQATRPDLYPSANPQAQVPPQVPIQGVAATPQTAATLPAGQPAPTAGEPKGTEEPAVEPLVFGKYKTQADAEKGYFHLLNYATGLRDKLTQYEQQPATFQPVYPASVGQMPGSSPGSQARVNPALRNPVDFKADSSVVKLAEKLAVEPDALAETLQAVANQTIAASQQVVQEQLAPLQTQQAMAAAEAMMTQRHPEWTRFAPEMLVYMQSADPVTQHTIKRLMDTGEYFGALEYGWTMFQRQQLSAAHGQVLAESQLADGARVAARANASLAPSSPGTPVHAALPQSQAPDPEYLKDLRERHRLGDQAATLELRRLTFGTLLTAPLQTWNQSR